MKVKGKDIVIYAGDAAVAACKNCSIELSADTVEISSPKQGKFREYIAKRMSWSMSSTHLVIAGEQLSIVEMLKRAGETFSIYFGRIDNMGDFVQGSALCTKCELSGSVGNLATGQFSWQGTGELSAYSRIFDLTFDNTFE